MTNGMPILQRAIVRSPRFIPDLSLILLALYRTVDCSWLQRTLGFTVNEEEWIGDGLAQGSRKISRIRCASFEEPVDTRMRSIIAVSYRAEVVVFLTNISNVSNVSSLRRFVTNIKRFQLSHVSLVDPPSRGVAISHIKHVQMSVID